MKNTTKTRQKTFKAKEDAEAFYFSLLKGSSKQVYIDVTIKDGKYIIKYRNENNIIRKPEE